MSIRQENRKIASSRARLHAAPALGDEVQLEWGTESTGARKLFALTKGQTAAQAVELLDLNKSIDNCPVNNFVVFTPTIHSQGDTGAASRIKITATKPDGTAPGISNLLCRVGVFNAGTRTESTNATIAPVLSTTTVQTISATKDLVLQETGAANLTTALSGNNNDLVYTAVAAGTAGNDITVAYVNPGTPSASLSVSVSNKAITVNLATNAGTAQVETATVVTTANSGPTEDGILTVVFVSALTGTVNVPVALLNADADDAAVATKIRAALAATSAITTHYTIGGSGADITATAVATAANDGTLSLTWDGYIAGVDASGASANTTAGVAPAITSTGATIKAAIEASAAASALVTVAHASGNDGTGAVTAMSATNLAGGAASDVFWFDLTNGTAETVTVILGPSPWGDKVFGDYSTSLNVTHAAP